MQLRKAHFLARPIIHFLTLYFLLVIPSHPKNDKTNHRNRSADSDDSNDPVLPHETKTLCRFQVRIFVFINHSETIKRGEGFYFII